MAATGNPVIATAALGLIPVITGARGNIASQLGSPTVMGETDRAGRSIGSRLSSSIMSTLKGGLKVGGIITGAVGALTLQGGLDRALGIEDARAMMTGLGHDTEAVDGIMANALASVEGTAFGLDAAATAAAGAVAAGIKPGEQLEQTMKTVANVAAGAKAPMEEIGSIFNTVAAVGTAYTGDINMIAQRGIPIWQALSKQLGKSQDEVKQMATKGQIDFATFEMAAREAAGGVATSMGDTTRGSFANMMASVRKLGAMFVTGVLPLAKTTFTGIQSLINAVKTKLDPFVSGFFEAYGADAQTGIEGFFQGLVTWVERFDPTPVVNFFTEVKGGIVAFGAAWAANDGDVTSSGFPGFMEKAAYWIRQVWDQIKTLDFSSFSALGDSLSTAITSLTGGTGASTTLAGIGSGLAAIAQASPGLLSDALKILGGAMGFVADHMDVIAPLLPIIVAGFLAWNGAARAQSILFSVTLPQRIASNSALAIANGLELTNTIVTNRSTAARAANTAATNAATAATGRATIAERARTIATKAGTLVSKAAAAATRLLGAAIRFAMGPVGLIITGVTLLVGALVYFFTQTEVGQKLWSKIWGWIKDAAAAVVDWFTGTALPYLQAAWDGIAAGALWLYENAILPAWDGIRAAIQVVGDWITGTLWPALLTAWNAIGAAALWLWQNVMQPAWNGIKVAVAVAAALIMTYIDVLKWYFSNVIAPVALWLWHNVITPVWNGIKAAIGATVDWIVNTAWPAIKVAWDAIAAGATWLWESVLKPAWAGIQVTISAVVSWLTGTAWPFIKMVWDAIAAGATWLWQNVITPVWNGIRVAIDAVVQWLLGTAWPLVQTVIGWLKMSFEGWKLIAQAVWNAVKTAVNVVVAWFRDTAWPIVSNVIERLKSGFNVMRDGIKAAWDFVKDQVIAPVANWFRDTIAPLFDTVTDGIGSAFDTLKTTIATAWESIKTAAKAPIKFVVETVVRDGIVKNFNKVAKTFGLEEIPLSQFTVGFAGGGILPGWSRMRDGDDQLVPMRRGEGVLVSEGLRTPRDRAAFLGVNELAKRGVGFSSLVGPGFAGGGILGDWWDKAKETGGDAIDAVMDGWDFATDVLTDPKGALTKLVDGLVGRIPGGGEMLELAKAVPRKIATAIADTMSGVFSGGSDVGAVPSTGRGGSLSQTLSLARSMGLVLTSSGRRGARTAQNGLVSLHALGRAHDYAGSSSAMMRFFNAVDAQYSPTELLYSPAGSRNLHRSGRRYPNTGATLRNHYSHVHVGFARGGIVPTLYDQGGEVPPGLSVIANRTTRPEKVLPPQESEALTTLAKGVGGDRSVVYQFGDVHGLSAEDVEREIEKKRRRRAALHVR